MQIPAPLFHLLAGYVLGTVVLSQYGVFASFSGLVVLGLLSFYPLFAAFLRRIG